VTTEPSSHTAEVSEYEVVVIGAGMGGLAAAEWLRRHGFTPIVLEKADEVGGTWRDNTYPGLYVDIPVSLYQMSFAPKDDWSHAYAPGAEIQEYLVGCFDQLDLRKYVTFGVEVTSAAWIDGRWLLRTGSGDTYTADAVIAATGFLHRKLMPRIEGMASFAGRSFHSSEWPRDLDVTGKRIGVVGTGSSGIQMVCALSEMDCEVVQYVRTPQWIETIKNPRASRFARLVGRTSRGLGQRLTRRLTEGIEQDPRLGDPWWKLEPGPKRDAAQQALREDLEAIRDPELRAVLTPDYPPGCKRIPKSPWYYEAVQRPNVHVISRGVDEICPEGVIAPDGTVESYDMIVYATGFDTHAYCRPMTVTGLDGVTLDEMWADDVYAYRGVAVPNLPNFYILNGPFSPVNNVTIPRTLDDELGWICEILGASVAGSCAFAPSHQLAEEYVDWIAAEVPRTVWVDQCDNWYTTAAGKTPIIWPWHDKEQTEMYRDVGLDRLDEVPCRLGAAQQRPRRT
jgi:cation diffusion facilitator CzcD-associated flavoprotein CzcO